MRPLGFQIDDRNLRRAGLDYWEHLEWEVVDDFPTVARRLDKSGFWYFSKAADTPYTKVRYQVGDTLVFGRETQGLPAPMLERNADRVLQIPIRPKVRSLNLSNAVAVAAYEALRQWTE